MSITNEADGGGRHEVVAPDSVSAADVPTERAHEGEREEPREVGSDEVEADVSSPAKIIRIGAMVKQLLEEVRNTVLDEAARDQLRDIYENSMIELKSSLSPELAQELDRLALDFDDDSIPSEAQLRVAKAQLVGWLEGLFHGIQATLMAQQMAARQQLENMRSQLPEVSGVPQPGGPGYI